MISVVLKWLRKGYPDGVPTTDYFPLLALLKRRLNESELDDVLGHLIGSGHLPVDRSTIGAAIAQVAQQQPTDEDISLVAARLAAAGWPLADVGQSTEKEAGAMAPANGQSGGTRHAFLSSILGWLRAGYPEGVPPQDYIPLLALLRRRLTDEETVWVADQIVESGRGPVGPADIGVLITKVTNEMPSEDDVNRVRVHLEQAGWPLLPTSSTP